MPARSIHRVKAERYAHELVHESMHLLWAATVASAIESGRASDWSSEKWKIVEETPEFEGGQPAELAQVLEQPAEIAAYVMKTVNHGRERPLSELILEIDPQRALYIKKLDARWLVEPIWPDDQVHLSPDQVHLSPHSASRPLAAGPARKTITEGLVESAVKKYAKDLADYAPLAPEGAPVGDDDVHEVQVVASGDDSPFAKVDRHLDRAREASRRLRRLAL